MEIMVLCAELRVWAIETSNDEEIFVAALRAAGVEDIVEVRVRYVYLGGRDSYHRPCRDIYWRSEDNQRRRAYSP
jgi:hypothetical protein